MHTLIISGSPWCPLTEAQVLLNQAGMNLPKSCDSGSVVSLPIWYERLFTGKTAQSAPLRPGKAWDLAASELFLANWEQATWGWSDSRNTWLLDYWLEFEPSTRFLLLHTPIYDVLSSVLSDTSKLESDIDIGALLAEWCVYQTEMLRFYHRHRDRCMFVHSRLALHRSGEWIQQINEKWAMGLNSSVPGSLVEIKVDPLLHLLIQGVLKNNTEIQALEAEIHATLLDGDGDTSQPEPDIFAATFSLRGLYQQLNQAGAVQVSQLSTIEANNLAIADFQTRLHTEQQLLASNTQTHLAELKEHATSAEKIKHGLEQERQLLLLQLNQVQEELEQHFLQGQDLKTQLVTAEKNQLAVTKENLNLKSTLDAETKAKTEAVTQRDAEAKGKTEALKQRDDETKAKTEALTQRDAEAKAKAEALTQRDAEAKAKTEALTQRDAEAKAKTEALTQRDAEAKGKSEALKQRDAEAKAKTEAQKKTDAEAKVAQEFKQESELLLLQLHQVQEELEQYFLQGQDLKTQLVTAEKNQLAVAKENLNLKSAIDAETKAKTEALTQRDAEAKAKAEALTQRDAEAKGKTEALKQRDAEAKAKAEALTQRDAEAKGKFEALKQRDAEAKAKTEAQKNTDAEAKVAQEFKQESELLLLQLHQVQEELENYFLQHQQASQDNKKLDARWKKLLLRYPDYVEWEHIEVIQNSAKKGKKSLLQCQIRGLNAGTRHVKQLDLGVGVVGALPVLMLMPPASPAESPLLYWPSSETDTNSTDADSAKLLQVLILDPAAVPDSEAGKLLRSLTQSDVQMVRVACAALIEGLPTTLPQRHLWVQYLSIIRQQLEDLPQCWRFDSVALKNQQVNPDYEHLWFALSNVYFGARHWPSFEFRLGAANIKRGKFSQHPKLEFPQQTSGAAQFENWFEESEDDRGPKFELRFDTSKKALDLNIWKALSPTDQAQLLSMSKQLPVLLQRLQNSGASISRPWSEWQNMLIDIQQAFQHSLSAPVLQLAKA